jgi:hypothetical protein
MVISLVEAAVQIEFDENKTCSSGDRIRGRGGILFRPACLKRFYEEPPETQYSQAASAATKISTLSATSSAAYRNRWSRCLSLALERLPDYIPSGGEQRMADLKEFRV